MFTQPALGNNLIGLGDVNANPANVISPLANLGVDMFVLSAKRAASETNGTRVWRKNGVVYQVPAGKKLQILKVMYATDTAAMAVFQLAYADTESSGNLNTNPVYEFGATSIYAYPATVANTWYSVGVLFEIPAEKYGGIQSTTTPSTEVRAVARLVDA